MKQHTGYPFQKSRIGIPATVFEKVGPFTLKISNHGFYEMYEVAVTGGKTIIKQASRPGLEDICRELRHGAGHVVPYKVFDDYMIKVNEFLAAQKTLAEPVLKKVAKRKVSK